MKDAKAEAELRKAEADAKAAEAGARKAEAEARAAELSALIPDLSKVRDSTLTVGAEGPAIGGSVLTFGALANAAKTVVDAMKLSEKAGWRVLVTSDPDLASGDAVHLDVTSGLASLTTLTDELLAKPAPEPGGGGPPAFAAEVMGAPMLAAVATAVPQVLSLLSAQRSVATAAVTVTDLAAAAAVAGELVRRPGMAGHVVHDDFRLVQDGRVKRALTDLEAKRRLLLARKLHLASLKAATTDPAMLLEIGDQQSLVDSTLASIDGFTSALRVVPAGGRRTPLATAALFDALHEGAADRFTDVLLVKAGPAQSAMLTEDQPLLFQDRFSVLVEVNVTFMLLATDSGTIAAAGTASNQAVAHGTLGESIRFAVGTGGFEEDGLPTAVAFPAGAWRNAQLIGDLTPPKADGSRG